jgi:hypothetical protein
MRNSQAPTSNLQRNFKPQAPIESSIEVVVWRLDVLWNLELGIWSFE